MSTLNAPLLESRSSGAGWVLGENMTRKLLSALRCLTVTDMTMSRRYRGERSEQVPYVDPVIGSTLCSTFFVLFQINPGIAQKRATLGRVVENMDRRAQGSEEAQRR